MAQVIGISGGIASGKSSVAKAVAARLNCQIASFGDYVRSAAIQAKRDVSRDELQRLSEELMTSLGPQGLSRNVLVASKWDREQSIVVDGVRHPEVIAALRREVSPLPFILMYLDVSVKVRAHRLGLRDGLPEHQLAGFDQHSTEREVGTRVREIADVIINADGDVEATVASALKAIGFKTS